MKFAEVDVRYCDEPSNATDQPVGTPVVPASIDTGDDLAVVVPLPNVPRVLLPHVYNALVLCMADACVCAADTVVQESGFLTVVVEEPPPALATCVGEDLLTVVPSPIAPAAPWPQTYKLPLISIAVE